jgi:hypothetical protein
MKAYGGMEVEMYIFLTSALAGGEWSAACPCHFIPRERTPGTHWIGGWVGPRAGQDDVEKILDPTGTQTLNPRSSSPQPVATLLSQRHTDNLITYCKFHTLWILNILITHQNYHHHDHHELGCLVVTCWVYATRIDVDSPDLMGSLFEPFEILHTTDVTHSFAFNSTQTQVF